jgi:hypothetical protein
MRSAFRYLVSFIALVLGTGTLSPIIQANWQAWAQKTGNDQYFLKFGGPIMNRLVELTGSGWFIFAAGFFVGGAACLWIDRLLRRQPAALSVHKFTAADLAHGLHMVSGAGLKVIVDKRKKVVQIGFNLKNSTEVPLRYAVAEVGAVVDGKTVMTPTFNNRGAVVPKGDITTFFFAPIPYVATKKDAQAEASILYEYGLTSPDQKPLREAKYRVQITIGQNSHIYTTLEENDAPI